MPTPEFLVASFSPQVFAVVLGGLSLALMAVLGAREMQGGKVEPR